MALALFASLPYPAAVRDWLGRRLRGERSRLVVSQSLGAFARPGPDISPLHVFFEVTNEGPRDAEIVRVYVGAKGDERPAYDGPFEADAALPLKLAPGESSRFWTRAKTLAGSLRRAGHGGRPRVRFVVEEANGNRVEKAFRFRVDEYLQLKDE